MRVSSTQIFNNLLSGINQQQRIQDQGNAQIASGTRFQTPAQAGLDYKVSLDLRHAQSGVKGSLEAIKVAENRLNISQTMLSDMNNVMTRAQAIAVQQASGGLTASQRASAAVEVDHLVTRFLNDTNQRWQGQSLFAGTAVDQPAFVQDANGVVSYNGNNQDRIVAITASEQVVSNVRGDSQEFSNAFSALKGLKDALVANDVPGIQNAIGQLNTAGDGVVNLTTDVGGRISAMGFYKTSYEDIKLQLDKQLNTHEAVDVPAVVAQMQQSSIALQAAYSQISQLKSLSLVNFLR